jgi:hypothetical protein
MLLSAPATAQLMDLIRNECLMTLMVNQNIEMALLIGDQIVFIRCPRLTALSKSWSMCGRILKIRIRSGLAVTVGGLNESFRY